MRPFVIAAFCLLLVGGVAGVRLPARADGAADLLDRYAAGDFDAVIATIDALPDLEDFAKHFQADAPRWIEAGASADRARRELVVATVALEASRLDEWHEWKRIVRQPEMSIPGSVSKGGAEPLAVGDVLQWSPASRLIKWASDLLGRDATPRPVERWWQLAAVAVAERSEDYEFLSGNTAGPYKLSNPRDEIAYVTKLRARFPAEARFVLAQGIATEWRWPEDARKVFESLTKDEDVGAEATMRLGAITLRANRIPEAITLLDRADRDTRDPFVAYLARFLRGRASERQRRFGDAEPAYRRALAVIPNAQSASAALSALLLMAGRRAEAAEVAAAMLGAKPSPQDPWREYTHADDRFWPVLVSRLRQEIVR